MFNKITKIDILALVAGLVSGPIAYYSIESGFFDLPGFGSLIFPGLVFGLFCIPFILRYLNSYSKVLLWVVVSIISYFAAYWIGFFSGIIGSGDLLRNVISYTVGGFVGSFILVIGYYFITKHKSTQYFIKIILVGAILPGILLLFFGVNLSEIIGAFPKDPYQIVMMTLWQGFMMITFIRLFRMAHEEKTKI